MLLLGFWHFAKERFVTFVYFAAFSAALITHAIYCFKAGWIFFLVLGIGFFPLGVIHGAWRWMFG